MTDTPVEDRQPPDGRTPSEVDRKRLVVAAAVVVVAVVAAGVTGWWLGDRRSGEGSAAPGGPGPHHDEGHGDHHGQAAADAAAAGGEDDGLAELLADHHYEAPSDEPLDSATRQLLTTQLIATFDLIEQYPTIADAEAGGWRRAGPFIPGLGSHYLPRDLDHMFTIPGGPDDVEGEEVRPLLIYDGLEDDAPLAGFMFMSTEEPEGFAGPYDHWHRHTNICVVVTDDAIELPFVADLENVTEEMCADRGGTITEVSAYMVHVWSVPGYESELGLFAEVNPRITCPGGGYHRLPYDRLESDETACRS